MQLNWNANCNANCNGTKQPCYYFIKRPKNSQTGPLLVNYNYQKEALVNIPKINSSNYAMTSLKELVIQSLNILSPNLPVRIQTKKNLNDEDSHQKAKTMLNGQLNNAQKHLPDIKSDVDTAMPYFMAVQTATI